MHSRFAAFRRILLAAALASAGSVAFATNYTWEGIGTAASWNTTSNWTAHGTPTTTSVLTFTAASATNNSPVITSGAQAGELLFSSGGGGTFSGTNALTIAGVGGIGIDNATANLVTFNNPFALTANQTWETLSTGSMTFGSTSTVTGPSGGTTTLTLSANSGTTITMGGAIGNGTGGNVLSLTEGTGTGTVVLSAANAYTGATTISAGTLQISGSGDLGSGTYAGTITDNGTLKYSSSTNQTLSGAISGTGALTKDTSATSVLTLSGNNTYSGATTISAGTLQIGGSGNLGSGTYAGTITDNGTFQYNSTANQILSNTISGTGAVNDSGASTLILTGTNNYSGATTIGSGATLQLGNATTTGTIASTSGITDNGTLAFDLTANTTISKNITGTGGVSQNNSGVITLSGTNNYTGATVVSTGDTLNAGSTTAFGSGSAVTITGTGNLALNGFNVSVGSLAGTGSGTVALGGNTLTFTGGSGGTAAFSGVIGGTSGAITVNNSALTEVLSGTNTYTGATTITAGTLQLGNGGTTGSIATTSGITDNGTLAFDYSNAQTFNQTISGTGGVSQIGGGTLTLTGTKNYSGATNIGSGSTLQIGNSGNSTSLGTSGSYAGNITDNGALQYSSSANQTLSGTISGTGSLTKNTGTSSILTLSGTNNYSGGTTISAGTVSATNGSAFGTGSVTVSNATLSLAGGGTVSAPTVFTNSGTLSLSDGTGGGALTNATGSNAWFGNIALTGNSTITTGSGSNILYVGAVTGNTMYLGSSTLTLNTTSAATTAPSYTGATDGSSYDESNVLVSTNISGSGGISKIGVGTATLQGLGNSYTGATTITGGTIIAYGVSESPIISGNSIYIGNASSPGAADSVKLQLGQVANGLPSASYIVGSSYNSSYNTTNAAMTIYADGLFQMGGGNQGLASLTMQGGTVMGQESGDNYSPMLSINNTNGASGGITTLASNQTALIESGSTAGSGFLALVGHQFTFNIATGTVTGGSTPGVDLLVSDVVENGYYTTGNGSGAGYTGNGDPIGVYKAGTGTLEFNAANTYQGVTEINQGVLNIQNNAALGMTSTVGFDQLDNGTQVDATGAQLQLQNNITISQYEALTLNGTGISSNGALLNVSGTNTWNGAIILGSNTQINANDSSTLKLVNVNNALNVSQGLIFGSTTGGGGQSLTFGGGGTTLVNGGIGGVSGALVGNIIVNATDGVSTNGTVIFAGANNYSGTTAVNNGTLEIANTGGLAGTSATVASGATMAVATDYNGAGAITVGNSGLPVTINGTGVNGSSDGGTGNGAIENISGNNTFASNITLGSASSIKADTGTTFTVSGNIGGSGENLTVGGVGNMTITGNINTGSGTLTKVDSGTVTLDHSSANSFTGLTTVSGGTLALGASSQLNNSNQLTIGSGGTFNLNTYNQTLFSTTTGTFALSTGGVLEFGTSGAGSTLTLAGSGTITFSGSMTGYGTIIVDPGVTLLFNSNVTDANVSIVLDNATLDVNGKSLTFDNLTFEGGTSNLNFAGGSSVIDFKGTVYAGVLTDTLDVDNWTGGTTFFYSTTEPDPSGRYNPPLNQIVFEGGTPAWTGANTTWQGWTDGPDTDHQIVPVPEPSVYGAVAAAFATGLAGIVALRRRRASAAAAAKI